MGRGQEVRWEFIKDREGCSGSRGLGGGCLEEIKAAEPKDYWGKAGGPLGAVLGRVCTVLQLSKTKNMAVDHTGVDRVNT